MTNFSLPDFPEGLLNQIPLIIAVFDHDLGLVWWNQNFGQFVLDRGILQGSLSGGEFLFDLWPEARRIIEPQWPRLRAGERMDTDTTYLRRENLDTYWDLTVVPQPEGANPEQFTLILQDVTSRIHAYQSLERQMADRMRKLKALYDVMQVASESLALPTMVTRALNRVLAAVNASVGMVHLLDEQGQNFELVSHQGLSDEMLAQLTTTSADIGLTGLVLRHRAPVVVTDIQANEHTRPIFRESILKVFVGVRMRAKGRIIGVLGAFWDGIRPILQEDIDLLDSAADQIGVAVESHRLRQKAEQLAVLEERNRLARDLHDSVSQALYSISLLATASRRLSQTGSNVAALDENLADLGTTAQQALKEMRLLLYRLRPSALQFDGLAGALRQRLDAVESRAGMDAQLIVENIPLLEPDVEEALYHIAQEALNNALKHAAATAVTVRVWLETPNRFRLSIADNGQGFDTTAVQNLGGMGLVNMRQRADSLGGDLFIESAPDRGTIISVELLL